MVLVDGHVHIHECFDLATFLSAMADNLATAARVHGIDEYKAVTCLTECSGVSFFDELHAERTDLEGWSVKATGEPDSLFLCHPEHRSVSILAGREIVTRERLEVLDGTDTMQNSNRSGRHLFTVCNCSLSLNA